MSTLDQILLSLYYAGLQAQSAGVLLILLPKEILLLDPSTGMLLIGQSPRPLAPRTPR